MARALVLLIAVAIALGTPALAAARQPATVRAYGAKLVATRARPSAADIRRPDFWPVGGLAAAVILGTCGLALWTERGRAEDDDDSDGDDGWGRGGSDRPRPPAGPGGHEFDWSAFETDFRNYARQHERGFELASGR